MLKAAIFVTIGSIALTTVRVNASMFENRYYAQSCIVTELKTVDDADLVTVKNANGFKYDHWTDAGDYEEGDYVSVIMDSMETELVLDDQVVAIRYDRPDLL